MKRLCFLLGLASGLYVGLHPLLSGAKAALDRLVEADARMRQVERDEVMMHLPVGWGEGEQAHFDRGRVR